MSRTRAYKAAISTLEGNECIKVGIGLTTDEASANISKKWNYSENVFLFIADLGCGDRKLHFVSSLNSQNLRMKNSDAWAEIMELVVDDLVVLRGGIRMYCGCTDSTVEVKAALIAICADNPRASNLCSVVGPAGSFGCRICAIDRIRYPLQVGQLRTKEQTTLARASFLERKPEAGLVNHKNPLLRPELLFDPHAGTPVDLLHTILLGKPTIPDANFPSHYIIRTCTYRHCTQFVIIIHRFI
jgi:hypothetical protein